MILINVAPLSRGKKSMCLFGLFLKFCPVKRKKESLCWRDGVLDGALHQREKNLSQNLNNINMKFGPKLYIIEKIIV